jgi:hypothetical protein
MEESKLTGLTDHYWPAGCCFSAQAHFVKAFAVSSVIVHTYAGHAIESRELCLPVMKLRM